MPNYYLTEKILRSNSFITKSNYTKYSNLMELRVIYMSAAAIIDNNYNQKEQSAQIDESNLYIGNLCRPVGTLDPNTRISSASQMIRSDPNLPGFCIIDDNTLVGVATRNQMNAKLSSQYGYSLYCNKGIETIVCKNFLCVDFYTTIDIVVKIAMQRDPEKIYDFITITRDGKYSGIVTVKDLLEKSIQTGVVHPRHRNLLTVLPGIQLERENTESNVSPGRPFILDFDIDNFKPYNDIYGFEKGDSVMESLARILDRVVPKELFTGQNDAVDFISAATQEDANKICRRVIDEFEKMMPLFYSQDDISRGCIISKNDQGIEEIYPLMSIIGSLQVCTPYFSAMKG